MNQSKSKSKMLTDSSTGHRPLASGRPRRVGCHFFFLLVFLFSASLSFGAEVEIRLVPFDQPDATVDKFDKSRPLINPVSTPHGMVMERVGVETVTWARNVMVDGKPIFERYHEGKYIDRLPVARADLKAGDHVIWPGNQSFTVAADGSITTKSGELLVAGNVVKVRCYPVTVRAFRANPDEGDLPFSMRVSALPNLTIRESGDAEGKSDDHGPKAMELLPVFDRFSPLTLWLPGNTSGKGYLIHPVGLTFHLTSEGVKPGAGGGASIADLRVEKNLIDIPLYAYRIHGDPKIPTRVIVPGVEQFIWVGHGDADEMTNWYPRTLPFKLQLDETGPTLPIDGDLRKLPVKEMAVDFADRIAGAQRILAVELETRHLAPGKVLHARVRALDTRPTTAAQNVVKSINSDLTKSNQLLSIASKKKSDAESALKTNQSWLAIRSEALKKPDITDDARTSIEAELKAVSAKIADETGTIASSTSDVDELTKKVAQLQADLAESQTKLKTVVDANPLADGLVFGQVQSYDGGEWKELVIKTSAAPREFDIAIPDVSDGVYRLRLGVKAVDSTQLPLSVDSWVTIAGDRPWSVGVFTERGRDSYYRGEGFWVGVGVIGVKAGVPAGTNVSLDLVDSTGKRLNMYRQATGAQIEKRQTIVVRIDPDTCLSLAPGHYQVEAKVGDTVSRSFGIDIVDPEPVTHFTNMLNMKYNSLGQSGDYARVTQTSEGSEQLAQWIKDLGYNSVMGMNQFVDRIVRRGAQVEQLVRERPELGPWESYYQPSSRDKFMSALLRRNIRFYEDLFTYNDTMLPREPRILDACVRYSALEAASMRHNPVFKGVSLYDEFYNSGDNSTPLPVTNMNYAAQEMAYRARYEKEGYTSARALKAFDRFVGRPFGQRDYKDLEMFRTWANQEDVDWQQFNDRMAGSVKRVLPDSFNFTLDRFWGANGGNIAGNGTVPDVFRNLDAGACVMYKDGGVGDRPVFSAMQADVLRYRDNFPVWTQIHDYNAPGFFGMHVIRQAFFSLQEKVEGFTCFTLVHNPHSPSPTDHRQTLKNLFGDLTNPYGDFFMSLDKGYSQIGIYYSRKADYLIARKPNSITMACEGIWVSCMRAGYPAQFLDDEQILAGKGDRFKVIFVPGIAFEDEMPPETLKALQKLVDSGKTIIVEKSSKLPIERIVHADSELDEYDDKLGGAFPRYEDFETEMVLDRSEEMTKLMKQMLPKYASPATESSMLFSPDWLKKGQGQYMVMCNWAPTKFTGLYKTLYQAPDMPVIRFPKRPVGAAYDVLEMKPVDVKTDGDWMTLTADLRDYPGKVYAFLPSPIQKVSLSTSGSVLAGKDLQYVVSVVDAGGQAINASFPLEITLTDPAGMAAMRVNRAAAPQFSGAYRVPVNGASGTWKLKVRELISGCVAKASISIGQGAQIQAQVDAREVWVRDSRQVSKFIGDKTPATIVVDTDQAWVLPQAQRLADALSKAGKPTKVSKVDEVLHLPADWDNKLPTIDGTRLWRGEIVAPGLFVDGPVILLGKRLESRLIEGVARRDALVESISANFPGPGKAIVAWVPLAFSNAADTVMVMGQDEASLTRGIDELLNVKPESEIPIRQLASAPVDSKAASVSVAGEGRAPTSYRQEIPMIDPIGPIEVDPGTGRVLVGTSGYGNNLFCFDAQGKLLWKKFLPEHNVYLAKWYDSGKRIFAATGRGPWAFVIDAADGKVLRKFVASEWPDGHGYDGFWEGQDDTQMQVQINPAASQIVIAGRTGLLAVDYEGKKMWFRDRAMAIANYPASAEQNVAATFNKSLVVGNFAVSPDGTRIVHGESLIVGSTPGKTPGTVTDLWAYRPMILDAKTGEAIVYNQEDQGSTDGWSVSWPAESADPIVHHGSVAMPLGADGKLRKPIVQPRGMPLGDGRLLQMTPSSTVCADVNGLPIWTVADEHLFPDSLDAISLDKSRLYRCDVEGLIRCLDTATGKTVWEYKLPFNGYLFPTTDGGLAAGTTNGVVVRLDKAGKALWSAAILDVNEKTGNDYAGYVRSALRRDVDNTGELYSINHDQQGDYDSVFKMGIEQLKNGSFEAGAGDAMNGWTSADGPVKTDAPGKDGAKSLVLPTGQLVTQRLEQRIIPHGTYLLEFWYMVPDEGTKVVAGALITSETDKQILTASKFIGRPGEWTFGRLAMKAMGDTKSIDIGFQSEGGTVRVDMASLRAVRFPSANLLANAELEAIEPTFVKDIRFQYDRIPGPVRDRLMSKNHVAAYRMGPSNTATIWTQEQAFIHNGRLDDLGTFWSFPPDPIGFSAVLAKPAWISHVVIYLNNASPDNVYRFISILANDMDTKLPRQVALVRGNDKRFVVVKFDKPIYTDSIKILPGYHGGHKECLTELELYGPLGGPDAESAGFPQDTQAYPMYMGGPTHVPSKPAADLKGNYVSQVQWNMPAAYFCGPTAGAQTVTYGNASGAVGSARIPSSGDASQAVGMGPTWNLATVTPISTPARFAGRLLVGSADQQLHAVSDQGVYLWGFKTEGRVFSSPLPNGDDVFFGSDDGRLYKVDIHSGMLLWEFVTGGRIRSSPAMADGKVYFASWDGFLYAVDAESGRLVWKAPVAPNTRSSPAVADGRVYIGDESGHMLAFSAADGSVVWNVALSGYISGCPLVTKEGILFLSEQGDAAMLNADGSIKWRRSLEARVKGEAFGTQSQVLIPTSEGLMVLLKADGQPDSGVTGLPEKQIMNVIEYQGRICMTSASMTTDTKNPPRTYVVFSSFFEVWGPGAPAAPGEAGKGQKAGRRGKAVK